MCVLYVEILCADRFELDWAHDDYFVACYMFMYFSCIRTFLFFLLIFVIDWYSCACLSLSFFWIVCTWHPSAKLLRLRTLFVPGHLLLLILLLFMSSSMMIKHVKTFQRTFLDVAFIRNAKSFFLTSPILIYPLSFTLGVGSPFMISRLVVPSWSYKSFIPICTDYDGRHMP